jgi:hypothetical protein
VPTFTQVAATEYPGEVAESVSVALEVVQADGRPEIVVTGGRRSMSTWAVWGALVLPVASTAQYVRRVSPWVVTVTGPE